jgi:hypothetical protein
MHARPDEKREWEGTEQVFDSKQESEALVVRGLLEANGIESVIAGLDAPQQALPGVGGVIIRVPAEKAEEARRLIEDHRRGAGDAEVSEEPAS